MKKKKLGFRLFILSALFIPALQVLFIVGYNSDYLIRFPFFIAILVLMIILFILMFTGLRIYVKNKDLDKRRLKKFPKTLLIIFFTLYIIGCTAFVGLLYGPRKNFKEWLITTAMKTMNHQYYCKWFYSKEDIEEVLNSNYIIESGDSTDASLINHDSSDTYTFENEYEEAILKRSKDTKYKIIELDVNGCKGYLAVIYDASKVKLAVTKYLGRYGQDVTKMAEENNAILAINGGGFYDPGNSSTGGTPNGITIADGKIVTKGEYGMQTLSGGIIGFNNDNVLMLLKNKSAEDAINMGIRDAVTWGPFLIVNGKASFIKGNGGWGYAARTAIGQRQDGIVLLLTVDSDKFRRRGADMIDLTEIMQRYGAYNAANLDGGTSTVMVLPKDKANAYKTCTDNYCYINQPIDGELKPRTRSISDAWIVLE